MPASRTAPLPTLRGPGARSAACAQDRMPRANPALERRWLRRIPGAATIAVLLVGCTSRPVALPGPGEIVARPGRAGVVVAAPRGTSDAGTGAIAEEIARRTG